MNRDRRARLASIVEQLTGLRDEEQAAFDNTPESIQGSARGEAMQEAIDAFDNAIAELEPIADSL